MLVMLADRISANDSKDYGYVPIYRGIGSSITDCYRGYIPHAGLDMRGVLAHTFVQFQQYRND